MKLDKPIYVGFSILDLRKLLMYEFHYKYVKNKFDAKLLFTDTDSLVHEIKVGDVCEDFYQDKNLFDFSDYPLNSDFFDPVNKNVIGNIKNLLIFCSIKVIRYNKKRIQSRLHRIGTYDVCKISLGCFHDKTYVLQNGANSLAYFHKDIKD